MGNLLSLKGLACILVVAYHVVCIGTQADAGPDYRRIWQLCDVLSLLRMPLFAFLSGFVFALRPPAAGTYWPFMQRKLARLYVPSLVVGMFAVSVALLVPGGASHDYTDLLKSLFYPVAQYWFIQALMVIFVVVGLAEALGLLSTLRRFALVLLVAIAVHLLSNSEVQLLSLSHAAYLLPFFVMGIGVQRYAAVIPWNRWCAWAVAAIFGVTCVVHVTGVFGLGGVRLERNTVMALLLSASSLLVACRVVPSVRLLDYIGQHSFTIFLFHMFFTSAMRKVGGATGMEQGYVLFAAGLLAGVSGPLMIELIVSRLPSTLQYCLIGTATAKPQSRAHWAGAAVRQ
jgi:fucose 4-O-acetylase-like acetyltransferase